VSELEPPDPLLEAALAMADDASVDWDRATTDAPALSESFANLRAVAELAHQYQLETSSEPMPAAAFTWGTLQALRRIGEGAFGEVWEAWDPGLQRRVALKLRRTGSASGAGAAVWLGEARRLARVRHDHVLTIHGADVHDGRAGLWTELLVGRTLEDVLREDGPRSAREATLIGLDLCAALAAVHAAGLAHGDVKTSNVMRVGAAGGGASDTGRIVLMDFGTSHDASPTARHGGAAGTPLACAPEVLRGGPLSAAADVYSLGVLIYRLVTDDYPTHATTLAELEAAHARGDHQPLRSLRPDLAAGFVQTVERALAHDPTKRFHDAAAMERALAAQLGVTPHTSESRTSRVRLALAAGVGALLVAVIWGGMRWIPEWTRPHFSLASTGAGIATRTVQTLHGVGDLSLFGSCSTSPGDIDGDGIPDLVVGAPGESTSRGAVHLLRGREDGGFEPWRTFVGEGQFGYSVTSLGDLDGDGVPDFAVGSIAGVGIHGGAGTVSILHGDRRVGARVGQILVGERDGSYFGYSIAGAGDVNQDGHPDLIVGAPLDAAGGRASGRAFVYLGGPGLSMRLAAVLGPGSVAAQFGVSVAGTGDIDGDGFADVAVGANAQRGTEHAGGHVAVFLGGRQMDSVADLDLYGSDDGGWFGISCAGLGDFDGDGFDDFAVGAERGDGFEPYAGCVSIFLGGQHPKATPARVLRGARRGSMFGHSLAAGDLDGDGNPDLLVGAYGTNEIGPVAGEAFGYLGGPSFLLKPTVRFTGSEEAGNFGTSVTTVPGRAGRFASVIVGAPYSGRGQSGAVWVFTLSRFEFTRPLSGTMWRAGSPERVTWLGRERAVLEWGDSTRTRWHMLARDAGGSDENTLDVKLPAGTCGPIVLRLRPADPRVKHDAISEPIGVR